MKHLVIIGASALGREVCSYAAVCGIKVKGFLDSRANVLDDYKMTYLYVRLGILRHENNMLI